MAGSSVRGFFVGREQELARLQAAFDAAADGNGALMLVVGEPGIGKTAICGELAAYAVRQGGQALIGHCYEEGSLSLPYLSFIEALRPYAANLDPEALAQQLGAGAGEVVRLLPELRDRLPIPAQTSTNVDPEEARYQLLEAVTAFLYNAAAVQPLLVVLEDLHDADRGTLDLLTHLVRRLAGSHMLVTGTYRDIEVDRAHPLSAALAELRRRAGIERIHLRGLATDEVGVLLSAITHESLPEELVRAVQGQTEGNPLFTQEVGRYLLDEDLLHATKRPWQESGGRLVLTSVPEGLRDVIGKRLSRLSPESNRLLGIAAVIGREFRLATLESVSSLSEDAVIGALEEASRLAILEERAGPGEVNYRFAHAFFRQTLYEELSAPRRLRIHQEVARALEVQYGRSVSGTEDHAAELAEHFAQSTDPADLQKAVEYAELAATRSLFVYAYGDAARYLAQALEVQEVLAPDDREKRCDLLLALGDALLPAGEPLRVSESIAPEALALAEDLEDSVRASRACRQGCEGLWRQRGGAVTATRPYRDWSQKADAYTLPGSLDRVYADIALSNVAIAYHAQGAWELLQRALQLARELENGEALYACATAVVAREWPPECGVDQLQLAEEFSGRPPERVSLSALGNLRLFNFRPFLAWGRRHEAEELLRQAREIADRTHDGRLLIRCLGQTIALDGIEGRLEEAVESAASLRIQAEELGVPGIGVVAASSGTFWPLIHLGRAGEVLAGRPEDLRFAVGSDNSTPFGSEAAICLAYQQRWGELQPVLERLHARWQAPDDAFDPSSLALTNYLAAAVLAQDRALVALLRDRLAIAGAMLCSRFWTCIARHLGAASALLGERESAFRYYEQALEVCAKVGFRPEIALTHLQIAELLLDEPGARAGLKPAPTSESGSVGARHASPSRADGSPAPPDARAQPLDHLEFAIAEFREMKMQPALERALAALEQARTAEAPQVAMRAETYPDHLTSREAEVLRLLAIGRSNPEIAGELVLSVHTVERHVANIYTKIGARGRAEAIAYALRQHLV